MIDRRPREEGECCSTARMAHLVVHLSLWIVRCYIDYEDNLILELLKVDDVAVNVECVDLDPPSSTSSKEQAESFRA